MATIGAADDLSLVPPRRLGTLVATSRQRQGLSLADVASRCSDRLSVHDLKLLEAGRLAVEDADVRLLAELLGLPLGRLVPRRTRLVVDRLEGRVIAGDSVGRFVAMASPHEVAQRYLALIRALRGVPGRESAALPLRHGDLEVLAEALYCSECDVRCLLDEVLAQDGDSVDIATTRSLRRPVMADLGLLVAFTALGGLVLVGEAAGENTNS
jgi:hypothetical protein